MQIEFHAPYAQNSGEVQNRSLPTRRPACKVKRVPLSRLDRPQVVATVHTSAGLRLAKSLGPEDVDFLELRLDALSGDIGAVDRAIPQFRLPILLTVRHPDEGGVGKLSSGQRSELFARFMDHASLVDVELRSVRSMRPVIASAKAGRVIVVISDHHFRGTPGLRRLRERQRLAFEAGADVFKLATAANDPGSMARLLDFSAGNSPGPRGIMGMGKFGRVSRLALARAGSALNYGYIDRPNAEGQWEARELRKLIDRLDG